jgi:hypothetical protein
MKRMASNNFRCKAAQPIKILKAKKKKGSGGITPLILNHFII